MLRMVSYPHRLKSGHITCYLNRTYHVLTTTRNNYLDSGILGRENGRRIASPKSSFQPFGSAAPPEASG